MQRDEDIGVSSEVYVAPDVVWRAVEIIVELSPRDARWAVCIVVVPVPLRATTRRVDDVVGMAARADVAARAVDVPDVARRADTLRVAVAARADVVVVARRGTTLRVAAVPFDFVRVKTLICAFEFDGVTPGFNCVRMVLFMYGYRLLYVFALT